MPAATSATLREGLATFVDPYALATLAELEAVVIAEVDAAGTARVSLRFGFPVGGYAETLAPLLQSHLSDLGFDAPLQLTLESLIRSHAVQRPLHPLPHIRNIVAVASGKGGVGKSTVAANLALAWAAQGARVGVLDADIYGPSQPLMLGIEGERPTSPDGKHIRPVSNHGVVAMSIGFLVDAGEAMIWRGPMVTQALTQLLTQTEWGELDYLVVDLPPGTGDIQLTLAQKVPVAGAVIVTTPQHIAVADARKGLRMFEKVSVPVLGIVENMSLHVCTSCGHAEHIFGAGGAERMAKEYGVPLLGELPLDMRIREEADGGRPSVLAAPDSPRAAAFHAMARRTAATLSRRPRDRSGGLPKVVVESARP